MLVGFACELLDRSGGPIEALAATAGELLAKANQTPGLTAVFTQFTANDPQIVVDIDREQAKSLGLSLGAVTGPIEALAATAGELIAKANQTPGLTAVFTQFTANDPQIVVDIDREQADRKSTRLNSSHIP